MSVQGYNFTEGVRKALARAREEAVSLRHDYVGTEHLLLGLLGDAEGIGAAALVALGVDRDALRRRVEEAAGAGRAGPHTGPDLPYTTRAKKVLELAMSEARDLAHSHVGTEHLLLGLIREEKGIAAQSLRASGVTEQAARAAVLRLLGAAAERAGATAGAPAGATAGLAAIAIEVRWKDGATSRHEFATAREAIRFLETGRFLGGP